MSENWVEDIHQMHSKFGVHEWMKQKMENGETDLLLKFLHFRLNTIDEEILETRKALIAENWEEVVDGLIDLCVFTITTLDAFGIDGHKSWDEVYEANMSKEPGVKPGRPNPWGLPDMVKPNGWQAPNHKDNTGIMESL